MPETLTNNVVPSNAVSQTPDNAGAPSPSPSPSPGAPLVQLPPSPRLVVPRHIAQQEVTAALKIGQGIYAQRIRDRWELDNARAEKQEWVQRVTDLLVHLFGGDTRIADSCNDWVAPILPEYAEVSMFIELFEREMKQRLSRVKTVLEELDSAPVVINAAAPTPPPAEVIAVTPAAPAPAPATVAQSPAPHPTQQTTPTATPAVSVAIAMAGAAPPPAPVPPLRAPDTAGSTAVSVAPAPATAPSTSSPSTPATAPTAALRGNGLLIVRSTDAELVGRVRQFVGSLGLTLRVLAQPAGEPLESFKIADFTGAGFALLLVDSVELHPGSPSSDDYHFTVGCCVGRLSAIRVTTLSPHDATLPQPPDQHGVAHVTIDGAEAWHLPLARQLKKAGLAVDLNKLL